MESCYESGISEKISHKILSEIPKNSVEISVWLPYVRAASPGLFGTFLPLLRIKLIY